MRQDSGHFYLDAEDWRELSQRMHGENDGSWILMRDFVPAQTPGAQPCVAIVTRSVGSLIIFITHLAEVGHPHRRWASMEDARFLADQVKVHLPTNIHPVYYLPTVHVREGN